MTVAEKPRPPAQAWWVVAALLDKADPLWWRKPPPDTSSVSHDPFFEVEALGLADRVVTRWVLAPAIAKAIAPALRTNQSIHVKEVGRR